MADYIADVRFQLRIKDDEAMLYAEQFLYDGLASLAYSSDPDDDHYSIESVNFMALNETYY
ncbi:MAG: hypothetical protein UH211_02575 [Agathobacter sp.]|nr:hypothetical protein [Agathobacter sp.]